MLGNPVAGVLGGGRSRRHRARCGAGQFLVIVGGVGEGDLHLDGLARVGIGQGVGGSGCPVDLSVVGQPLVGEGSVAEAVGVGYASGVDGQGLPHLGRPAMAGNPVAGVLGGGGAAATAPVAALVSSSSLSAASVKDTFTLTALPSSASARV